MSDLASNPSGPAPATPDSTPAWRVLRAFVVAGLSLATSLLGLLVAIAALPVLRESLAPIVAEHKVASYPALIVTLLVALLVPMLGLWLAGRRGWLRWPVLAGACTVGAAVIAWLIWDEPTVRRPLTTDEIAPALPGDDASYKIVLRYAKGAADANTFKAPKLQVGVGTAEIARDPEKWTKFLREHRAEIEAEWAAMTPLRAWWDELAAGARIGDLTKDWSSPIPAFQPMRSYSQFAVAIASLQALDGHGDEAMATLTRLYSVARKFEPNSRTLVRSMIAKVIQKLAFQTAGFVLDRTSVSPAAREAFAAELRAAAGGPAGARRLILIEYAFFQPNLSDFLSGGPVTLETGERVFERAVRIFGRLLVNPIATQNLVGDRYYQLAALAEERRLGELEVNKVGINRDFLGGYGVKNFGGRLIADMSLPAFSKVVKSYWDIEDLRAALLARLKA